MNQVRCDECGYYFIPKVQEIKGYMFFKCPNCERKYPIAQISPHGLELRKKLNKERERYGRMKPPKYNSGQIMMQFNKIQKLEAEFKSEVTDLGKNI